MLETKETKTKPLSKPEFNLPKAVESNPFVNYKSSSDRTDDLDHRHFVAEDAPISEINFHWFSKRDLVTVTKSPESGGRGFMLCKKDFHEHLFKPDAFDNDTGLVIYGKWHGEGHELYLCMRHESVANFEREAVYNKVNSFHGSTIDETHLGGFEGVSVKENKITDSSRLTGSGGWESKLLKG